MRKISECYVRDFAEGKIVEVNSFEVYPDSVNLFSKKCVLVLDYSQNKIYKLENFEKRWKAVVVFRNYIERKKS